MKAFPNYAFMPVDIEGLYNLEKKIFGITEGNSVLTPNEFFLLHTDKAADLLTAAFYLCWIPVPLMFAFYLYLENKNIFLRFSFAFFVSIASALLFIIHILPLHHGTCVSMDFISILP